MVFGPKPRDYSKKIPKSVRRLAFRKALSERIMAGDVLMVETSRSSEPKTKQFISGPRPLSPLRAKVLIISASFDETPTVAARNVQSTLLITAADVNTEQLPGFQKDRRHQRGPGAAR